MRFTVDHRSVRAGFLLLCALGLLGSARLVGLRAQQTSTDQQPSAAAGAFVIRSQTNLVLVDVRVRDKSGRPVTDLRKEDFRVFEDGVPQTITSFSLEDIERLTQATAESAPVPTIDLGRLPPQTPPATALRDRRLTVLFFDLTSMPVEDLLRAVDAGSDFMRSQMTPADLVAVVTYTASLRVIHNFTNDRDALDKALKQIRPGQATLFGEAGATGEAGSTGASGEEVVARDVSAAFTPDETEFNIFNTDQKLAAIESLARMLRDVPGRKAVIHFSSGVERTGVENQAQLRATIDAANQANVSLYTMDARGLVGLPPGGAASEASPGGTAVYTGQAVFSQLSSLRGGRETLATLAADTGGRTFYDLNDFGAAFQQVQSENSSYYLLGYSPSNRRSDGRFRRIRVKVSRPGLRVDARPGYFAPKDFRQFTREDKELQLQQAMDLDTPFVDLPLVVEAAYFRRPDKRYFVVLAAKLPGSAISFLRKSATHQTEFDFAWRAADGSGQPVGYMRDTLPVKLSGEEYERVLSSNILYQGGFVLPAGKYTLKVVVRENQSGRLGTFEQPLKLPETGESGLALSSVMVSNQLEAASLIRVGRKRNSKEESDNPLQVGNRSILPSVTRVFRTNQNLYLYLESYLSKQPSRSDAGPAAIPPLPPSVALVFFRSGVKIAEAGPFPGKLEGTSASKASYFVQIPLEKFVPGRYVVQVNVLDPAADRVAFARLPVAIMKPPAGHSGTGGGG